MEKSTLYRWANSSKLFVTFNFSLILLALQTYTTWCESAVTSGHFRWVSQSQRGFEYLDPGVQGVRSKIKCGFLCLQNLNCTGFVFYEEGKSCRLITEFCGASKLKPAVGRLYTRKELCPTSKHYRYINIGAKCRYCLTVIRTGSVGQSYEAAMRLCQADGGNLLHFEGVENYDFRILQEYFPESTYSEENGDCPMYMYWVGIKSLPSKNGLNKTTAFVWDHTGVRLTDKEQMSIPWETGSPVSNYREETCVYLTDHYKYFANGICSENFDYICMIDLE